jgi:hypothetical protein
MHVLNNVFSEIYIRSCDDWLYRKYDTPNTELSPSRWFSTSAQKSCRTCFTIGLHLLRLLRLVRSVRLPASYMKPSTRLKENCKYLPFFCSLALLVSLVYVEKQCFTVFCYTIFLILSSLISNEFHQVIYTTRNCESTIFCDLLYLMSYGTFDGQWFFNTFIETSTGSLLYPVL